ncbi:hypothetical protein DUNSADRAFT_5971 [Dunaliella salina]|uniref:Uncharacterized protein n=1 Tax=Dunaliella salina TaxID=3046 RepID=A0ABQ7GP71_DUNSA|nr:hypothetical protein DUNSADRAFT_5971 [Dunaliella salina]|eukprot:KAF5836401.1 hypothetical protein DUNSADRAFT_5971 [Dunaliella salina]
MLASRVAVPTSITPIRQVANPALQQSIYRSPRRTASVTVRAISDTNFFLNLLESASACTVAAGVAYATAENKDKQLEDLQKLELPVVGPLAAAVAADAIAHSIPGLNVLLALLAEPSGAAAGVAYLMSIVLSSQSVDPKTLAPEGTVLNAEKAMDSRAALRVPFTQIVPTAIKVVDTDNDALASGAGWKIGQDGLPKLPINSVLIVLGVGGTILEAASHAPVLGVFMPRVLQVAGWLAAAGFGFEVLGMNKKNEGMNNKDETLGTNNKSEGMDNKNEGADNKNEGFGQQ